MMAETSSLIATKRKTGGWAVYTPGHPASAPEVKDNSFKKFARVEMCQHIRTLTLCVLFQNCTRV